MSQKTLPYIGRQLDQDDSFRLLELQSGNPEDPITASLHDARLNDPPSYEALSYVWGDASDVTPIQLSDGSSHRNLTITMLVTVNCHAALKRLRKLDQNRFLWVDAICINQGLIPERNHQLTLMARIYLTASRVVVYLGETADDSDLAMNWIRELDDSGGNPWEIPREDRPSGPTDKSSLQTLFQRPWFNRMWVLQEISLAKTAIVICGVQEVDWKSFYHFYHWNTSERWLKDLPYSLKYQASRKTTRSRFEDPFETRLLKMLASARHCASTDPRDKLYGILPLLEWESQKKKDDSRDGEEAVPQEQSDTVAPPSLVIKPDYALSPSEVFTDVATKLMQFFGLDLLQEAVNPPLIDNLPSWAPDWTMIVARYDERKLYPTFLWTGFSAGTKHENRPGWEQAYFRPTEQSNNMQHTWRTSIHQSPNMKPMLQLHAHALRVGRIQNLGDICSVRDDLFPLEQWSSLSPNPEHYTLVPKPKGISGEDETRWFNGPNPLSPFFRTLTADDVVYPEVIVQAVDLIRRYNGMGPLSSDDDASQTETPTVKDKGPLAKVFQGFPHSYKIQSQRILNTCDGKRFFVTDSGFIGLAPGTSKEGDDVYVLEGASSPFVFRQLDASTFPDDSAAGHEDPAVCLVGTTYIQGIMHGEIWEDFEIRGKEIIIR
jgi:hypothetical protein